MIVTTRKIEKKRFIWEI